MIVGLGVSVGDEVDVGVSLTDAVRESLLLLLLLIEEGNDVAVGVIVVLESVPLSLLVPEFEFVAVGDEVTLIVIDELVSPSSLSVADAACVGLTVIDELVSSSSSSSSSSLSVADATCVGLEDDDDKIDKVIVLDGVFELLGVIDGLEPLEIEAVGVSDCEALSDAVELGVNDDVAVPLIVADGVGVLVAVNELVVLPEFELLAGVFEGLAPRLIDADDEKEIDEVRVIVEEAVSDEVPVPEFVALAVGVTDCVFEALTVDEGVIGGDTVALNDIEGEPLAEPPMLSELVGVAVIEEDRLATIDSLPLTVLVPVGVCDDVLEPVPVGELVEVGEGEGDGV